MPISSSNERLRFDHANVREEGQQCHVEVMLTLAGNEIRASATGGNADIEPLKAAAVATLKAVEQAVANRFNCVLADLDHVNALGKDLIAVLVDIDFENKQVQVFGSCQIAGSEIDAAVKASLNATNRFFELAMRN